MRRLFTSAPVARRQPAPDRALRRVGDAADRAEAFVEALSRPQLGWPDDADFTDGVARYPLYFASHPDQRKLIMEALEDSYDHRARRPLRAAGPAADHAAAAARRTGWPKSGVSEDQYWKVDRHARQLHLGAARARAGPRRGRAQERAAADDALRPGAGQGLRADSRAGPPRRSSSARSRLARARGPGLARTSPRMTTTAGRRQLEDEHQPGRGRGAGARAAARCWRRCRTWKSSSAAVSVADRRGARCSQGSHVALGAQNMHAEVGGAYTGEVSPRMLKGLCQYVLVGQYERRILFAEKDAHRAAQAPGRRSSTG